MMYVYCGGVDWTEDFEETCEHENTKSMPLFSSISSNFGCSTKYETQHTNAGG